MIKFLLIIATLFAAYHYGILHIGTRHNDHSAILSVGIHV